MNTDFRIADHGSIIAITPVSAVARVWIDENTVTEGWQWMGGALCVDHRPGHALVDAIINDNFIVEQA